MLTNKDFFNRNSLVTRPNSKITSLAAGNLRKLDFGSGRNSKGSVSNYIVNPIYLILILWFL
jgi:hypothetical protein